MKRISLVLLVLVSTMMIGCAATPQSQLPLADDFYSNKSSVVGVYMDEVPKADTQLVGASCLLCYAVAAAANSSLTSHMESLSVEDLASLDKSVEELIKEKGVETNLVAAPIILDDLAKFKTDEANFAKKDFRPLKETLGVSKLVVIDFGAVGAYRSYNAYVPTSSPMGNVSGLVYTVDLETNKYELYETIDFKVGVDGEWDEPSTYPGVTNAYYEAVEQAKDKIIALFK